MPATRRRPTQANMAGQGKKGASATDCKLNAKIMGKCGQGYKVEELQRLLQEFGILWTTSDQKADLIVKLSRHTNKHPELTHKERRKILNCQLDVQPIRYQVLDDDGNFKHHSYPSQIGELLEKAAEKGVAKEHQRLVKGNARECSGCERYINELDFPRPACGDCLAESSVCRSCADAKLKEQINKAETRGRIFCPACSAPLNEHDVKHLTTKRTYEQYLMLEDD